MIPSKAYIIRISDPISQEYAATCAQSCIDNNIPYEFFEGVEGKSNYVAWLESGIKIRQGSMDHRKNCTGADPAACCSVSHALIWKRIYENDECAIILEHDALMLHPVNIDLPDNRIVVLGYKLTHTHRYNHKQAGPPKIIRDIHYHHGAHAYAITAKTAGLLLKELEERGGGGPIDNRFFLRERTTSIPLAIADPTPAIGWLRKSTIWKKACSSTGEFIDSFQRHLK